MALTLI